MKFLRIVLVVFVFSSCNKKAEFVKAEIKLSEIDSLKTDEAIEGLIGNVDSLYKKIELRRIQDFQFDYGNVSKDSIFKCLAKREGVGFKFQRADFDNNGFTDLLVVANNKTYTAENTTVDMEVEFSEEYNTVVLMNFGNNKYKLFDVSEEKYYWVIPKVVIEDSQAFLKVYKPKLYYTKERVKREESAATLTFKFGDFVEYNPKPVHYGIEKVEFYTRMCAGECPIFKINISKDRKARMVAQHFNYSKFWSKGEYVEGGYSAEIKEKDFDDLCQLLCYIDFPNLKNDYRLPSSHHQDGTLKITYNNGKVKTINDFGLVGTYGLKKVYDEFFKLRFNQEWKKNSVSKAL